jgi:hypothetical protein
MFTFAIFFFPCAGSEVDSEVDPVAADISFVFNCLGGRGGIRTHERLAPLAVFKTAALNHSATRPRRQMRDQNGDCKPRKEGALNATKKSPKIAFESKD